MPKKRTTAALIFAIAFPCSLSSCGPEVSSSHGKWTVTLSVDEPGRLAVGEPVLLLIRVRNGSGRPMTLDPVSIKYSNFEVELEHPSGARSALREGIGGHFGCGGFEVPAGETVTTYEMLLPQEPGAWTIRARVMLREQSAERESWSLILPELGFHVGPGTASEGGWQEEFLLGRVAFLGPESDDARLTRLSAASPRLHRFVMLAKAMTTVMSHRYSYTKEDEQARRILEAYADLHPRRPLSDVALLGLAKLYTDLLPWSDREGDSVVSERALRRVSQRLHREYPGSAVTLGLLGFYDQYLPTSP